jgi:hypothetical protein
VCDEAKSKEGKLKKAKVLLASMFVVLGATTSFAQYARDATTEGQATINEEQKLGPDAITHQIGNARIHNANPMVGHPASLSAKRLLNGLTPAATNMAGIRESWR